MTLNSALIPASLSLFTVKVLLVNYANVNAKFKKVVKYLF